jgi:hypothetical protein
VNPERSPGEARLDVVLSVRVRRVTLEDLRGIARREDRSLGAVVRRLIGEALLARERE